MRAEVQVLPGPLISLLISRNTGQPSCPELREATRLDQRKG
jgi:hypothetical protein